MSSFYNKYELLPKRQCQLVVDEIFKFKKEFYIGPNLKKHVAYLADEKPGRYSHAYAVNAPNASAEVPGLPLEVLLNYPMIAHLTDLISRDVNIAMDSRFLLNMQEYFSDNTSVPKHFDGELLDFEVKGNELEIKEAVRPEKVAVLVLVNDVGEVGTRIHFPDGSSEMVSCKAGEVVVFDNVSCFHSVDAFQAKSKRKDGLVRMTLGWRSLNTKCHHFNGHSNHPLSTEEANQITAKWYKEEWPKKWAKIFESQAQAAF